MKKLFLLLTFLLASSISVYAQSSPPENPNYRDFKGQASSPTAPIATRFRLFFDSGGALKSRASNGTVSTYNTGSGTVSSVALTLPSFLSVSGSPVTTTGTFAVTLATETANTALLGPTTGAAATPTFRALVPADIGTGTAGAGKYVDGGTGAWTTLPSSISGLTTNYVPVATSSTTLGDSGIVVNNTGYYALSGSETHETLFDIFGGDSISEDNPELELLRNDFSVLLQLKRYYNAGSEAGEIRLWSDPDLGGSQGYIQIHPSPAQTAQWDLTLPTTDGTPNQFWQTDGSGVTTWTSITEFLSVSDLTTYTGVSGSGSTALASTISSPSNGQVLTYSSGNWINSTPATSATFSVVSVSSTPYTAGSTANTTYVYLVDATSADITVNLAAVSGNTSVAYRIKKIDSSAHTVTIDANSTETIDGSLTRVLTIQYESVDLHTVGSTGWYIF